MAESLVSMLNSGEFGGLEESGNQARDEQNIKRRVYDALNVLISADVIQRNGKMVLAEESMLSEKARLNEKLSPPDSSSISEQIAKRQANIEEKKATISSLKYKKELLDTIFRRNKKNRHKNEDKIFFPLIGVLYPRRENSIHFNQTHSKVSLDAEELTFIGDMDMLTQIGIDVLSSNIEDIMGGMDEEAEEEARE